MKLINISMSEDSFAILKKCAERVLSLRKISLGEGFEITFEVDTALTDERYVITSDKTSASLRASCDLALFAAFGRFLRLSNFDGKGGFDPFIAHHE